MKTYRFKKMYIEITNICNLDCCFCPKNSREKRFMSIKDFETITTRLQGFGKYLNFHVMGEPLLHPELSELLAIAERKDFKVNITTNGVLIEEASEKLLSSGALRQINFSLHSFEANTSEISMDSYLEKIIAFSEMALSRTEMYIALRLWNMNAGSENIINERIFEILEDRFNIDYKLKSEFENKNSVKIAKNLYLNLAGRFDWPDLDCEEETGRAFCYGLRDQIGILADGTVIPCCLDNEGTIALGNLLEQPMENILESDRVRDIYNGFTEGRAVEELCRKCSYRTRFQG